MALARQLVMLALQPLVRQAFNSLGAGGLASHAMGGLSGAATFLTERFADHGARLEQALDGSTQRAWKVLDIALAGNSLWRRLERREDRALGEKIRAFLAAQLPEESVEQVRTACLAELRRARKAGHLEGPCRWTDELAREAVELAAAADQRGLLDAEWRALDNLAGQLHSVGYPELARLVTLRPTGGESLLAIAVRYYFRRAIEEDEVLARAVLWETLDSLSATHRQHLVELDGVFARQGQQLDEILDDVAGVREIVQDVRNQVVEIKQTVLELLRNHKLNDGPLSPRHSLSIRDENEKRLVKRLLTQFRQLDTDRQRQLPDVLNDLGKLLHGTGEFRAAREVFAEAAAAVPDDSRMKGEAHHNSYLAALEQEDWAAALDELRQAVVCDRARYEPFPLDKYVPLRILGAGGFGVVFLCEHHLLRAKVAVKTLATDHLDRNIDELFEEARTLLQLDHPNIIRLLDCSYADPEHHQRPYLLMEYFDGVSLRDYVAEHGPLSPRDLLVAGTQVCAALDAAHQRNILHRDVKPGNILVRKQGDTWQLKLIDFGLAVKAELAQEAAHSLSTRSDSHVATKLAGTLDYAAPEQMGRLAGTAVGPYSDVYSFGKTCCYSLFKKTSPLARDWKTVPQGMTELLDDCLSDAPQQRPQSAAVVLKRLQGMDSSGDRNPLPPPPPDLADEVQKIHERARKLHEQASQMISQQHDYAGAVALLSQLPEGLRDQRVFTETVRRRDRVALLDAEVARGVREQRFVGLRAKVAELAQLQPNRADMRKLLETLSTEGPRQIQQLASANSDQVKNYLIESILLLVLCNPLLAIPALIYALQVDGKRSAGDLDGARKASESAKLWCLIALGVGLLCNLAILPFFLAAMASA